MCNMIFQKVNMECDQKNDKCISCLTYAITCIKKVIEIAKHIAFLKSFWKWTGKIYLDAIQPQGLGHINRFCPSPKGFI